MIQTEPPQNIEVPHINSFQHISLFILISFNSVVCFVWKHRTTQTIICYVPEALV